MLPLSFEDSQAAFELVQVFLRLKVWGENELDSSARDGAGTKNGAEGAAGARRHRLDNGPVLIVQHTIIVHQAEVIGELSGGALRVRLAAHESCQTGCMLTCEPPWFPCIACRQA